MENCDVDFVQATKEHAISIINKLYGLSAIKVHNFVSYFDKNFYVEAVPVFDENIESKNRKKFVLKIINSVESCRGDKFEVMYKVMQALNAHGIRCPEPVRNLNGGFDTMEDITIVAGSDPQTSKHRVLMHTYIPGTVFNQTKNVTLQLLYEIGKTTARMDEIIQDFHLDHDVNDAWNIDNFLVVKDYVSVLEDEPQKLQMVMQGMSQFEKHVLPNLRYLKRTMIHADMNESNILIDQSETNPKIAAILDFGDLHSGYRINEIAICITYILIADSTTHLDYLEAAAWTLAGYTSIISLSNLELGLLHTLVISRLVQNLVYAQYSYKSHPENQYLLLPSIHGWDLLSNLILLTPEDFLDIFRSKKEDFPSFA